MLKICNEIESIIGRRLSASADFAMLSSRIHSALHEYVSPTTLKRIWGYLNEDVRPRKTTLDLLARFVGFRDYEAFISSDGKAQSNPLFSRHITDKDLQAGQRIRLCWGPNRRCMVEHLGNGRFEVVSSENAKITVGDTFRCHLIIEHEPMYMDDFVHADNEPVIYVAGRKDGVTYELL